MDRRQWHHSRHLVHYGDARVDPTCSLHCTAIGLALNIDRAPRAVYAADYGAAAEPRPLVAVDPGPAWYLVGSDLPGTMTRRSKMAFAREADAQAAREAHGGEVTDFDGALTAAYLDMAADTRMVRRKRAERRRRAAEQAE
jgi:nitrous oxide reductase accessory protein NosL